MDSTIAETLRKPFPPEQIGHLPRSGIQLDYVGHADVTSRLLEADPEWFWEPMANDEVGLPVFDLDAGGKPVGLWIKLTVGGVTRLGYGSVPGNQNDAVKVLIGDALRNAAMRFGVAVDLWAKGDRADPSAENASGSAGHATSRSRRNAEPAVDPASAARAELLQAAKETGHGSDPIQVGDYFKQLAGKEVRDATVDDIKGVITKLRQDYAAEHPQAQAS